MPFFRFLWTTHAQKDLVPTSVAARVRVFMEGPALRCANMPNTSLTAPARWNTSADFVRSGEHDPVRSNSKLTRQPRLGCTLYLIRQTTLSTKLSVILNLKIALFGLLLSHSAWLITISLATNHSMWTTLSTRNPSIGISSV